MNDTARHLAVLAGHGRGQGYLELRWRTPRGMRSEYFAISAMESAAARARVLGPYQFVYPGAAPRWRRSGTRAAIREGWTLWVDCDDPDSHQRLDAFSPRPALAIASGSGGTHAYWPLSCSLEPDRLEDGNRRLACALDADPQSTDAARILRPVGTHNRKHWPARPVALRWFERAWSSTPPTSWPVSPGLPRRLARTARLSGAILAGTRCWPSRQRSMSPCLWASGSTTRARSPAPSTTTTAPRYTPLAAAAGGAVSAAAPGVRSSTSPPDSGGLAPGAVSSVNYVAASLKPSASLTRPRPHRRR